MKNTVIFDLDGTLADIDKRIVNYWLEKEDSSGLHFLEVIDFDEKDNSFCQMKRWGADGDNQTGEAIIRPLVELGKFTIVSEHDESSPQGKAQLASLNDEPVRHGLTLSQTITMRDECTDESEKDYWKGRVDGFEGSAEYQEWLLKKEGNNKASA